VLFSEAAFHAWGAVEAVPGVEDFVDFMDREMKLPQTVCCGSSQLLSDCVSFTAPSRHSESLACRTTRRLLSEKNAMVDGQYVGKYGTYDTSTVKIR